MIALFIIIGVALPRARLILGQTTGVTCTPERADRQLCRAFDNRAQQVLEVGLSSRVSASLSRGSFNVTYPPLDGPDNQTEADSVAKQLTFGGAVRSPLGVESGPLQRFLFGVELVVSNAGVGVSLFVLHFVLYNRCN